MAVVASNAVCLPSPTTIGRDEVAPPDMVPARRRSGGAETLVDPIAELVQRVLRRALPADDRLPGRVVELVGIDLRPLLDAVGVVLGSADVLRDRRQREGVV